MYGLIRLRLVAFCSLAGAKESEEGVFQVELHKARNSQASIAEAETAFEWLSGMLNAVACDVDDISGLERRSDFRCGGRIGGAADVNGDPRLLGQVSDACNLVLDNPKCRQSHIVGAFRRYQQNFRFRRGERLRSLLCSQEGCKRRCIR
jgi:hypothetical protein